MARATGGMFLAHVSRSVQRLWSMQADMISMTTTSSLVFCRSRILLHLHLTLPKEKVSPTPENMFSNELLTCQTLVPPQRVLCRCWCSSAGPARDLKTAVMLVPFETLMPQDLNKVVKLGKGDAEMAVESVLIHVEEQLPLYARLHYRLWQDDR
ncbi:hypothetical protein AAFF_G00290000 [Aldrovandia affinis]|uniref:Uncharacterized protein n=1 Tax=Aldrovandia affinis TaxID=143900 RepID=A0AAD7R9V9_9TELE|nr:hypothetical protein AAFF_G00290000 [Aldrovandia affinis]